MIFNRTQVDL